MNILPASEHQKRILRLFHEHIRVLEQAETADGNVKINRQFFFAASTTKQRFLPMRYSVCKAVILSVPFGKSYSPTARGVELYRSLLRWGR